MLVLRESLAKLLICDAGIDVGSVPCNITLNRPVSHTAPRITRECRIMSVHKFGTRTYTTPRHLDSSVLYVQCVAVDVPI